MVLEKDPKYDVVSFSLSNVQCLWIGKHKRCYNLHGLQWEMKENNVEQFTWSQWEMKEYNAELYYSYNNETVAYAPMFTPYLCQTGFYQSCLNWLPVAAEYSKNTRLWWTAVTLCKGDWCRLGEILMPISPTAVPTSQDTHECRAVFSIATRTFGKP